MATVPAASIAPRRASIRAYLLRLVLAVALPLAALEAWNLYGTAKADSQNARRQVLHLAQLTASETAKFLGQARNILNGLAARPAVRALDPARCDPLLKDFIDIAPRFANAVTVTAGGRVACSAAPLPGGGPIVADPSEFRKIQDRDRISVGKAFRGPVTDRWLVPLAIPLQDARGEYTGAIALMVDLLTFPALPSLNGLPESTIVDIIDGEGTVLARSSDAQRFVGTRAGAGAAAVREKAGTAEVAGVDGIARIQGFTSIPGTDWIAVASVPASVVYAGIQARIAAIAFAGIAVLIAALLLALRWSRKIRIPITALATTASTVAAGDLAARAPVGGAAEIAQVAVQFNRMLDALAATGREFRTLAEASPVGIYRTNAKGDVTYVNARWCEIAGISAAEAMNEGWAKTVLSDRDRVYAELREGAKLRARFESEFRFERPDGSVAWVQANAVPEFDASGEVAGHIGAVIDITARKGAELALQESAARLKGLSHRLIETQEDERTRIARELHDELGQALSVVKIRLQSSAGAAAHGETIAILDQALAQVRGLALDLHPPQLDDLGLAAALRSYIARAFGGAAPLVELAAPPGLPPLPPTVAHAVYRIAQEAIGNAVRHAGAASIRVALAAEQGALVLDIADDGKGFDLEAARARARAGTSLGSVSMEERARLAGGTLTIRSAPNSGTTVTARLPL